METLYKELYNSIKDKIENKEISVGEKLPYEKELMDEYEVSRDTVRKALDMLKNEGYIYSKRGSGTFVKNNKIIDYSLNKLLSYSEIIKSQGKLPSSIVYSAEEIIIPENLKNIFIYDSSIYKVVRVRRADSDLLCYEITYISKKLCPDIIKYITPNSSLYHMYENIYDIDIGIGNMKFKARMPNKTVSKILELNISTPVFVMTGTVYTLQKSPLYYVEAYYNGDKYTFETKMNR